MLTSYKLKTIYYFTKNTVLWGVEEALGECELLTSMPQTHRHLQRELAKGSFGVCANADRVYRETLLPLMLLCRDPQ